MFREVYLGNLSRRQNCFKRAITYSSDYRASLGAFEGNKWPPFTSHIAIELFRKNDTASEAARATPNALQATIPSAESQSQSVSMTSSNSSASWFASVFSWVPSFGGRVAPGTPPPGIGRKPKTQLEPHEKARLQDYYVRLRYNDEVVTIPGCKAPGKHLEGNESFCTLVSQTDISSPLILQIIRRLCKATQLRIQQPKYPPSEREHIKCVRESMLADPKLRPGGFQGHSR